MHRKIAGAAAVLAAMAALAGCNPVTKGPGGWVNGFSGPSKQAQPPAAPSGGGDSNPCPGGNGYETWHHGTWNCGGKLVTVK